MALQTEEFLDCPYCGERVSILVDHSVPSQNTIEDCEVCCHPIELDFKVRNIMIDSWKASRID